MNKKWNGMKSPFMAMILSAGIFLTICLLRGIMPFGTKTFIQIDLYHQYAPFYEELRERILTGRSLFYSWEGALGKEFLPQLAYYTSSPLGLLVLLFPAKQLPAFIQITMLLKNAMAAGIFCWYAKKSAGMKDTEAILFALLYAWCGFCVSYYWNIMWMDAVALFPLTAYGVEQIVDNGKWKLYTGVLALTIFSNFYIAFLVCELLVLYFLLVLFLRCSWKNDRGKIRRAILTFILASGAGGMAVMFLLLPTVTALSQTEVSNIQMPAFRIYQNIYQILSMHMVGGTPIVLGRNEDAPNLYSGVLAILLAPGFFMSGEIRRREKIGYGLMTGFLLLCCVVQPLDFIIHGGHFPANLPHRFTFVYTFLLLQMAMKTWTVRKSLTRKHFIIATGLVLAFVLVPELCLVPNIRQLNRIYSNWMLLAGVIFLTEYLLILWLSVRLEKHSGNGKKIRILNHLLLFCIVVECTLNGCYSMRYGTEKELTVQYMDSIEDVKKRVEEMELGNFYRMEFRRFATINDGALLHYPGVNQFSSLAPGGISGLMKNIGVSATGNSYRYYDPTPMIDALLGVKYILNGEIDGGENAFAQRYEPVGQAGNIWIYRNPQVLPVGFAVSDAVTSWEPEQETPFVSQDALAAAATGETEAMYRPLSWDSYEVRNITVTESAPNHLDYEVTAPEQLDLVPEATIRYVSDRQQYLYLYTNVSNTKRLVYRTEGTRQDREIAAGNGMIDVGWVDAGEVIEIHVELTEHGEFEKDYRKNGSIFIAAAGYQPEVWDRVYEQLNRHPWTLTAWGDTSLTGTIDADEHEILFTSIPYIRGWEASVDGTPVEITPIGHNGFIGVALPSGTHEVHLEFHVPALKAGILLSVLTWLLIAVWCVFERRIRPEQ